MTALREDEFPMSDSIEELPNILVVEASASDQLQWGHLNKERPDLFIKCYDSINMAMVDWMQLYAVDHIPRVLVCGWANNIQSMGCLTKFSENGTEYDIDGPAFALYCCLQSVGDSHGMFIAYAKYPQDVTEDISKWPEGLRNRIHVKPRTEFNCLELLQWILSHEEFVSQRQAEELHDAG